MTAVIIIAALAAVILVGSVLTDLVTDLSEKYGFAKLRNYERSRPGWNGLFPLSACLIGAVALVAQVLVLGDYGSPGLLLLPVAAAWVGMALLGAPTTAPIWHVRHYYRLYVLYQRPDAERKRGAEESAPAVTTSGTTVEEQEPGTAAQSPMREPETSPPVRLRLPKELVVGTAVGALLLLAGVVFLGGNHGSDVQASSDTSDTTNVSATSDPSSTSTYSPSPTDATGSSSGSVEDGQPTESPSPTPSGIGAAVTASDVAERSAASAATTQNGTLQYGDVVYVDCQVTGQGVTDNEGVTHSTWAKLTDGNYVLLTFLNPNAQPSDC